MEKKTYSQKWVEKKINEQLKKCKYADKDALYFIFTFLSAHAQKDTFDHDIELMYNQFRAGYCYHFAHMLQSVFNCGSVLWAAPLSHFVWQDEIGTVYDIEGVYDDPECMFLIPEEYLGDYVNDFKHFYDETQEDSGISEEELDKIMEKYIVDSVHVCFPNFYQTTCQKAGLKPKSDWRTVNDVVEKTLPETHLFFDGWQTKEIKIMDGILLYLFYKVEKNTEKELKSYDIYKWTVKNYSNFVRHQADSTISLLDF